MATTGHGEKRSRQEEALIGALLTSATITEAAKLAKVSESTARRWLRERDFRRRYRQARQEVLRDAVRRLQGATGAAVDCLVAIVSDKDAPATARIAAASKIFELARTEVSIPAENAADQEADLMDSLRETGLETDLERLVPY